MTARRHGGVLLRWASRDCSGFVSDQFDPPKFFEDIDWMGFTCLRLLCLRMQCALMMAV
ncbi:hypothetical protein Hdeb2414_s0010g00338211 [Helianthus debilis subsp. tardiflorus]